MLPTRLSSWTFPKVKKSVHQQNVHQECPLPPSSRSAITQDCKDCSNQEALHWQCGAVGHSFMKGLGIVIGLQDMRHLDDSVIAVL